MNAAIAVIFGLIVGSFLNAVIFRLYRKESFIHGRSRCMSCRTELSVFDLIPVVSFALLGGRCRYCRTKLSWQYPAVEALTGVLFFLAAKQLGFVISLELLMTLVFICFLIVIAVYDLKHYLILDKVVFPGIALSALYNLYLSFSADCFALKCDFPFGLLGGFVFSAFFFSQYFLSRGRWIGFGDVKLGFFIGSLLGFYHGLFSLFLAYLLGAATGLILILLKKKNMSSRLPFGTFLSLAAVITMLFGANLIEWYLDLIGL